MIVGQKKHAALTQLFLSLITSSQGRKLSGIVDVGALGWAGEYVSSCSKRSFPK